MVDKFGHCVLCGKCMIIEEVIDMKPQVRFTPEYGEEEFLLSDGSHMRVAMCRDCKATYNNKDHKKIMECVKNGWEEELRDLDWKEEKKKSYRDKYYKLSIKGK